MREVLRQATAVTAPKHRSTRINFQYALYSIGLSIIRRQYEAEGTHFRGPEIGYYNYVKII